MSVIIAVGLAALGVAWLRKPTDPRAYAGSSNHSLEKMFERFSLKPPPCETDGLRYFYDPDMGGTMYLRFEASESCVREFLAGPTGRKVEEFDRPEYRRNLINELTMWTRAREFGWPTDPAKDYLVYWGSTAPRTNFEIAVDPSGPRPIVYLYGFRV
ncbi:hypothetical protein [Streptoalloteichus hindustanus]|uniref:hypothetical protein n=1 Tax=Streptoalloteichus hindustanus TaxID=2017 RepID=UPI001160EEA7|nr:hypothetical protein [Streptoalloteichus hindustanus]